MLDKKIVLLTCSFFLLPIITLQADTPSEPAAASLSASASQDSSSATREEILGAKVKKITVKDGWFNHRMLELETDPLPRSMLSYFKLVRGSILTKVNGKKVYTQDELETELRSAKSRGRGVTITYRDQSGKYLERTRSEI